MEKDALLGPLFTVGAVFVVAGLVRRSWPLAAAGAAAVIADQRLPLGQKLKDALSPE